MLDRTNHNEAVKILGAKIGYSIVAEIFTFLNNS